MKSVGAFDAKTHFSKVLNDVKLGESYTITHRKRPIAIISPINDRTEAIQAIKNIAKLTKSSSDKAIDLKALIEEGRR